MHNPGTEHWGAIERLIGYIQRKDNHELVIRIPIEIFRDSSYADCEDTQRNITGDIHTIGGRLVSWQAKKTMRERVANEIIDAFNNKGNAVKKREETHKMADANRAFSHFRW